MAEAEEVLLLDHRAVKRRDLRGGEQRIIRNSSNPPQASLLPPAQSADDPVFIQILFSTSWLLQILLMSR